MAVPAVWALKEKRSASLFFSRQMKFTLGQERTRCGRGRKLGECLQHHVAQVRAGDACIGDRRPGNDLPVEGIDDEGETDDLASPAGELQPIAAGPAALRDTADGNSSGGRSDASYTY
jgi:hypothetical protein